MPPGRPFSWGAGRAKIEGVVDERAVGPGALVTTSGQYLQYRWEPADTEGLAGFARNHRVGVTSFASSDAADGA
jgi:hypothetical protein